MKVNVAVRYKNEGGDLGLHEFLSKQSMKRSNELCFIE